MSRFESIDHRHCLLLPTTSVGNYIAFLDAENGRKLVPCQTIGMAKYIAEKHIGAICVGGNGSHYVSIPLPTSDHQSRFNSH